MKSLQMTADLLQEIALSAAWKGLELGCGSRLTG